MEENYENDKDTSHWDKPKERFNGSTYEVLFQCPNCGSWNTGQATYVDYCNSCNYSQGY